MVTDRKESHLDQVSSSIREEQENSEKEALARKFVEKATTLMFDYGPTEYVHHNWKEVYRRLPCGVINTPDAAFYVADGKVILVNIIAEVTGEGDNKYGSISTVGINFKDQESESQFTVHVDGNGAVTKETMPGLKDLQNGLLIIDNIKADYRHRKLVKHEEPEDWDHR